MQANQCLPSVGHGSIRSLTPCRPMPTTPSGEPPVSAFTRWTKRLGRKLVAWGEGATQHRMGSWMQR